MRPYQNTASSQPGCPVCTKPLIQHDDGQLICPDGHGVLVTGKYLSEIDRTPAAHASDETAMPDTVHELKCPHCTATMHKVDFRSMGIIIDSCARCHYRWLDAGEAHKIRSFKPAWQAKDLLFILSVDERLRTLDKHEAKDPNPRLPLQASYRGSAEVLSIFSSQGYRVRLAAVIGQGLFGIYKGLVQSKTSRYLVIATIVIFGLLFWYVFREYDHLPHPGK